MPAVIDDSQLRTSRPSHRPDPRRWPDEVTVSRIIVERNLNSGPSVSVVVTASSVIDACLLSEVFDMLQSPADAIGYTEGLQ